jgi:hypothetical protein
VDQKRESHFEPGTNPPTNSPKPKIVYPISSAISR